MKRLFVILLLGNVLLRADLSAVKAEPDPEKRSDLALAHAESEVVAAKKAYEANEMSTFRSTIEEVADLAELSLSSLESTGKRARKNPKYFKRAEQKLLVLIRRVDSLEKDVGLEDREGVGAVRKRLAAVQERILHDIMTKK